jgi:acyl-homoserine lactone acylase PvdQ
MGAQPSDTYEYPKGTTLKYQIRNEIIKVYGWPDQQIVVKDSVLGPIINDVYTDYLSGKEQLGLYK